MTTSTRIHTTLPAHAMAIIDASPVSRGAFITLAVTEYAARHITPPVAKPAALVDDEDLDSAYLTEEDFK